MTDRVFRLSGSCNNYPWGKKGQDSLAARLCAKGGKSFRIEDDKNYSELWFGDYPDFPGSVYETGEPLKGVLERNKGVLLGTKVIEQLDGQLPFLPKVYAYFSSSCIFHLC
jgi:mannose-6-phosphate isomerase